MTNAIDSGSTSSPASSWKEPAGIQFHMVSCMARSSGVRPTSWIITTRPTTNEAQDIPTARSGPNLSVRRPPSRRTAAPSSGSAMSSHAKAEAPLASATTS